MDKNACEYSFRNMCVADITGRRGCLLHAVNMMAAVILASDEGNFESALREGMELMARCLDIDRIYVWQNEMKADGLYYIQSFEWLNNTGRMGNTVRSKAGFSYAGSMPEWEEKFRNRECVNGPIKSLSRIERERLEPYGIQSILVIPVHLQDYFWGFVSFDDCHRERSFTEDEISILRSGGLMMASVINRNETVARMHEADERAKLMLDATPLCCYLMDEKLNGIDCNEEAVKLFELRNKQEYLDRFFELSPEYQPDGSLSDEKSRKLVKKAHEEGGAVFEWMHQKLDGTPIPSEITLVRVKYGDGYIVAGYTRDLREYKKMMNEIEHKDDLLRTVNEVASILLQSEVDEFGNAIWRCMGMMANCVGADRAYIWKNHVKDDKLFCTQLYEWSEGAEPQQGGEYTVDISYDEIAPRWNEKLTNGQCINSLVRDMPEVEQPHLFAQGILSILVVPLFLRDEFWGFIGFDDCHRERVFSNNEKTILHSGGLLIANALLRNEMTLGIRSAVAEAQAASRAKSSFLSRMSHEMRTPMNAIIGMTSIGRLAPDKEKKDYAFGKIKEASDYLLGVINDILDMSKIEAHKFELSDAEFSFEKMLQKVINVVGFRINEKRQDFSVSTGKDIPRLLIGDDQRLAQIITNLISNAVKFTPEEGSITLNTHLVSEEDGLCTIQIEVADTGIGIGPELLPRLFDSFEQAGSYTSRKYGGTGLGLAISKNIVELMGGNIWVESEPDKGSTFFFTFKAKRGSDECLSLSDSGAGLGNLRAVVADGDLQTSDMTNYPGEIQFPEGYCVLLAEDVEINREIVMSMLEPTGLEIDCAKDGAEAVDMFKAAPDRYDMIFMDLQMPEVDGLEATRRIRALSGQKAENIPIIAMTANVFREDIEKCLEAGMNDHVGKPLNFDDLIGKIKQHLRPQPQMLNVLSNQAVLRG